MTESTSLRYRINEQDKIIFVSDAWEAFALANAGVNLERTNVLQHSLFDFIADETTRLLYRNLLQRVRSGHQVQFPLRCDAPAQRRWLEMRITLVELEVVEFTTRLLRSEARTPLTFPINTSSSEPMLVRICSWCQRIEGQEQQWVDLEEAVACLHLFEQVQLSQLNHGICDDCFVSLKKVGSI